MSALTHNGVARSPILSLLYGRITKTRSPASRIYQPLQPGKIRLLKVLPATDDDDADQIVLKMESVALEDAGPYDILSYVWGDAAAAEISNVVRLNDVNVRITTSLFNALRRYRQHASEIQRFWIDALCVDQTDLTDRSLHVSLMTGIYTRAETIVMWSGEAGDGNTGMLFKTAKARHETAKHRKLLQQQSLDALPVVICGEGPEVMRSLAGVGERVLGLGCRSGGGLMKRLEALGVDDVPSEA
ncbi:hypothetical protein BBK36DRAFT_20400 [Trichoderma citrinoviride]|uniref:Heterokaryon incompatibility domain-containing protein n=1 Tax=Trichoderma citrinoviride TaxID=58853 RepID=A0A2T4B8L3_9HYPO|nr:hypothetical protein BBK36DRAFT_20400 [Trichoderma citrinoviride]PTB65628.1 hypothetical protein BBK36DRAFT_20400 [Trichoderma citrinoviride]